MFYAKSDFKVSEFGTWKSKQSWGGWYVGLNADHFRYLHSDLEIRQGCNVDGVWSGYYATEQDAWNAVDRFLEKQGIPGDEKPVIDCGDLLSEMVKMKETVFTLERRIKDLETICESLSGDVAILFEDDNG